MKNTSPGIKNVRRGRLSPVVGKQDLFRYLQLPALVFLFMAALAIRLYHVDTPPLNFHATRQYRSLIIARGYYYESQANLPAWKQEVASLNMQRQAILEPPVMEFLAAAGYRLFGSEHYWIPKSLSILFWLIGALFLYRIAERIADAMAALFALAFYLFLPFAIIASRSFQPDPLMVMLLLASVHTMLHYYQQPSKSRLVILSVLSALAIFIKPVSLFPLYMAFILLSIQRQGLKKSATSPGFLLYFGMTLLPAFVFYLIYGLFLSKDLRLQAQASFVPQLLLDPFFWKGWLNNARQVVPLPIIVIAVLGTMMFSRGLPRILLSGLWVGYVLFCLVFSYHIATHDYYHLQLVPLVALSLGASLAFGRDRLAAIHDGLFARLEMLTVVTAIALSLLFVRYQLVDPAAAAKVSAAEEVGDLVNHNTSTVYLASDYGLSLEYHGELSGKPWPLLSDLEWERLAGVETPDAEARFDEWFAADSPDYFIVMDFRELEHQEDLGAFLRRNFSIVAQSDDFLIFDLQSR